MGDAELAKKFQDAGLVPNVIPKPPLQRLGVTFYKVLQGGDHVHSLDVRPCPKIEYTGEIHDDDYFTLIMIDADYPRREKPTDAEFMHWMICNIKADPIRRGKATGEQALVGYLPPTPVANSGEHRLVLLLFRHPKKKITQPSLANRTKFSTKEFMQKHGFDQPVAGVFCEVQD